MSLLKKNMGASLLGVAPDDLIVAPRTSKGYQLLKAMGGKRHRELSSSSEESDSDEGLEAIINRKRK